MTVFVPSIRFRPAKRETMQARLGSSGVVLAATLGLLTSTLSSAQVPDARSDAEIEAEVSRLQQLLAQRRQSGSSAPEETRRRNTSELAVLDTVNVISNAARTPPPLEQLKDIPKSVSVVAGEELEKTQTNDFRNILSRIGNVSQTYTNPQSSSLVIRGLGWTTGAGPLDPSVGVTVDGVSYGVTGMGGSSQLHRPGDGRCHTRSPGYSGRQKYQRRPDNGQDQSPEFLAGSQCGPDHRCPENHQYYGCRRRFNCRRAVGLARHLPQGTGRWSLEKRQ